MTDSNCMESSEDIIYFYHMGTCGKTRIISNVFYLLCAIGDFNCFFSLKIRLSVLKTKFKRALVRY